MNTISAKVSFDELEKLFNHKTTAFTPKIMFNIFDSEPEATESDVLPLERFRALNKRNVIVASFAQMKPVEVIERFDNKQLNNFPLYSKLGLNNNGISELVERPRKGLCLISIECIPDSYNKNFYSQTLILANFVEKNIPEIRNTEFWIACDTEMRKAEPKIDALIEDKNYSEAAALTKNLLVNRHFRPTFSEIQQIIVAYNRENNYRLYENTYTISNSTFSNGACYISIGNFDDRGIQIASGIMPYSLNYNLGCSFICSLNLLKAIL